MEQPLTRAAFETLVRLVASGPVGIWYRPHCWERMRKWHVDASDVVRLMRNVEMIGSAYRRSGEWRYKVRERLGNAPPERKDIVLVLVVDDEGQVWGLTVYRGRRR
jgi:hypothetical protein